MDTPPFELLFHGKTLSNLRDVYETIDVLDLWSWIVNYEPEKDKGNAFWLDENVIAILENLDGPYHSDEFRYAFDTLQKIQQMGGWDAYYEDMVNPNPKNRACPCRRDQGYTSGWCGVAGGGVPACEH